MKNVNKKVIVAMSGGVDSSVAAALLKKQGYFVIGIFMKFWKDPSADSGQSGENRCCSVESEKIARLSAKKIDIPFYVVNAEKEFKKAVVNYFLDEYKKGNTPNPCVLCNREIKFGLLMQTALKLGADFLATGHYVQIKDGKMFAGSDKEKDQSYFLWMLKPPHVLRLKFPVGALNKTKVRALAREFGLPAAESPESQEVCFISGKTNDFLKKYLKKLPGRIVDMRGRTIGEHEGLWFYTIGQRRGLSLDQKSAFKNSHGSTKPYFVAGKDFKKNLLVVSNDQSDLLKKEVALKNVNLLSGQKYPFRAKVKIRYRQKPADAVISRNKIVFSKPQKGVTPGQSAVFYINKEMIGGGIIR